MSKSLETTGMLVQNSPKIIILYPAGVAAGPPAGPSSIVVYFFFCVFGSFACSRDRRHCSVDEIFFLERFAL